MNDNILTRAWWRKAFFGLFGMVFHRRRAAVKSIPDQLKRILVLAPVAHGDYLVLTPLLAGLSRARPRAEIAIVVTKTSLELAEVDPLVHRVFLYYKLPGWFLSVARIIRYRPDVVIVPKGHPAFTESMILMFSSAPFRIGLSHPNHDALLTHPVKHNWDNEHRSEAFVRLLEPFGLDPTSVNRRLHIGTTPWSERFAERTIRQLTPGKPWVSLNLSASTESRRWTLEKWRVFITEFIRARPAVRFLLLSAPQDSEQRSALASEFTKVETVPTRRILNASALIARTDMLVTVDTGIVQVAAARDVPTVVLYNGDHEVYTRFAPQSVPHRALLAPRGAWVVEIDPYAVVREALHLLTELGSS